MTMIAIGPCFACREPFPFNPDLVQSVLIDPVTKLTTDLGGNPGRAQREPVCPGCCKLASAGRRKLGLTLLDETDTAGGLSQE